MRPRPSTFVHDVLLSGAAAGATMVSQIVVTGWLAASLGPAVFGTYALARRLASAVGAVTPGPTGVALTRALALTPDERDRGAVLCAATVFAFAPTLAVVVLGLALAPLWAALFLSGRGHVVELVSALGLVVGNSIYMVAFARLRGTYQIGRANLLQFWALAAGPLLVAVSFAHHGSAALILGLMAAVMAAAALPLGLWVAAAVGHGVRWPEVRARLRELLAYGMPRIPGAAAFGALLAIGPFLAPYFGDLREAGYLVAGQSMLRVVEMGTMGFGLVALPRITALHAGQRHDFLRDRVADIVAFVVHLGLFAACQFWIWTPEIVRVWLGPAYEAAIPIVRILGVAAGPYLGYTLLRSVIDALEERAVNTQNLYAALALSAVLSLALGLAGLGAVGLAWGGTAGFVLLGLLTVRFLRSRLEFPTRPLALPAAVLLNAASALVAVGIHRELAGRLSPPGLLVAAFVTTLGLLAGYLTALRIARVRWLLEVEARLLPGRGGR